MRYMMLVFQNEQAAKQATEAELEESEQVFHEFHAEMREHGGIYIFECEDLDEAVEIASKIPTAESGAIEVRPVYAAYA